MLKKNLNIFVFLIIFGFLLYGCGGKGPTSSPDSSSTGFLALNIGWKTDGNQKTRVIPAATEAIYVSITGENISPSISETIHKTQVLNNTVTKKYELPAGPATATIQAKSSEGEILAFAIVTATIHSDETQTTTATLDPYVPIYLGTTRGIAQNTQTYMSIVQATSMNVLKEISVSDNFAMKILLTSNGRYAYTLPSQSANPYSAAVINTLTEELVTKVNLPCNTGETVQHMAIRSYGGKDYVYYTYTNQRQFFIIDTTTNTLSTKNCDDFDPFGNITPRQITFSSDGVFAFVTSGPDVYKLNLTNDTFIMQNMGFGPAFGIVITPNGNFIYVARLAANTVTVRNTSDLSLVANIAVGNSPGDIFISPDGNYVCVLNSDSNSISVISTGSNTVVATINFPAQPAEVAFDSSSQYAYVTCLSSGIFYKIDVATSQLVSSSNLGYTWIEGVAVKP